MTELMTQTNEEGETLLQEQMLNRSAYRILLFLAMSVLDESHKLIPEVRREIVKAENKELFGDLEEGRKVKGPAIAALITYRDETSVPILQDQNLSERTHTILLSLALTASNDNYSLIPEIRREIVRVENEELLSEEGKNHRVPTIAALITYQDEAHVPVLQDQNLSQRSYSNLISLALSVLEDVVNLSATRVEEEEDEEEISAEERRRTAAKVLPVFVNIRSEEEERVSKFYQKMKKELSEDRNKKVKEELEKNKSIPSDVRKELGLK